MSFVVASVTAAAAIVLSGCGGSKSTTFDASKYTGTYSGTWKNEKTGASGPVTIAIRTDEGARTATLTIDFGGNYLGLGDPPAVTLHGTYDDKQALARGTSELFGNYDVTIAADGAITGLMTDVGGGAVPKLSYTGTLTDKRLDADYEATLADGRKTTAILRMTKM